MAAEAERRAHEDGAFGFDDGPTVGNQNTARPAYSGGLAGRSACARKRRSGEIGETRSTGGVVRAGNGSHCGR
jgi:hypothetical protein